MFIGSRKFLFSRAVGRPETTITLQKPNVGTAPLHFTTVNIDDPAGNTKLGTGTFFVDDVIVGASVNSAIAIELTGGRSYSMKVTNLNILRSSTGVEPNDGGSINLYVARLLNMYQGDLTLGSTRYWWRFYDPDNSVVADTAQWTFSSYSFESIIPDTGPASNEILPTFLIEKMHISNADATRTLSGPNPDDSSMALIGDFQTDTPGANSASITIKLVEGFF